MSFIPLSWRPAWLTDRLPCRLGRRQFLATSLAVGFAAAVRPVSAEAIHTGEDGLNAGPVTIPVPGGALPAYQAYPSSGGPFPVVVVVQEIFGVHEYIRDVVRRIAKLGYVAIAPDLYFRQGDATRLADIHEILSTIVAKVPDDQVMADLDSTLAYAKTLKSANAARAGITGFCWGGRVVWLYAAHNPALKAAVAWYGMLGPTAWRPDDTPVLSLATSLKAPVLGLYGGRDTNIPPEQIARMQAALAGSPSSIVVYEKAGHGFHADYRPTYDKEAAEDGWARMTAWFKDHGV